MSAAADETDRLERLEAELAELALEGHWRANRAEPPPEPTPPAAPFLWRWAEVRPKLMEAGSLRAIEGGASRRTLRFCTPGMPSNSTTPTIHASVQLVQPGEVAAAHRHSIGALRFVIEGAGGHTTVEGERFAMAPGDLVLTPHGTWHDHANEGREPMIWLDGHDLPLMRALNTVFFEPYNAESQEITRPDGESARRGGALRPRGTVERQGGTPYAYKGEDALALLKSLGAEAADPCDGRTVDYVDPLTGGPTLPTIACRLHLLAPGERLARHRHTASAIYHVVEGAGETRAGEARLAWGPGDTFVIPGWTWHEHAATGGAPAVLFSMSDEPLLAAIGHMRTETAA